MKHTDTSHEFDSGPDELAVDRSVTAQNRGQLDFVAALISKIEAEAPRLAAVTDFLSQRKHVQDLEIRLHQTESEIQAAEVEGKEFSARLELAIRDGDSGAVAELQIIEEKRLRHLTAFQTMRDALSNHLLPNAREKLDVAGETASGTMREMIRQEMVPCICENMNHVLRAINTYDKVLAAIRDVFQRVGVPVGFTGHDLAERMLPPIFSEFPIRPELIRSEIQRTIAGLTDANP